MGSPTPLIGVSMRILYPDPARELLPGKTLHYAESHVAAWIEGGGALPLLIPPGPNETYARYAQELDGLVLQGGSDIAPENYRETPLKPEWAGDPVRDAYELALIEAFLAVGKPILGICRGCQLLNVAFGGSLYQDIDSQVEGARTHRVAALYDRNEHSVELLPSSSLAALYPGVSTCEVNSIHHQALKDLGKGLVVEAVSRDDRVIEAVRGTGPSYVRGIQWHPEFISRENTHLLPAEPLLRDFLEACAPLK